MADLERIKACYLQPGPGGAAPARLGRLIRAMDGLRAFACLYTAGVAPGTRVMVSDGRRVIYEVNPDTGQNATAGDIMILRVLGPGQRY